MKFQPIDLFASRLDPGRREAVYVASKNSTEARRQILFSQYQDPDALRRLAGDVKQHVIENLDTYLLQAEKKLQDNGVQVHWAGTAEAACQAVLRILRQSGAKRLVKSKTMLSEEIALNEFLELNNIEAVETDLGEFIVQLDGDHPSHIVKPVVHKNRRDIARTFEQHGLGSYNDEPQVITQRAREHLRQKYLSADAALTGANFLVSESGRIVLVTNEGNARFCLAATRCHIALVGIEKLLPRDRDLGLFLNLLTRSATGQPISVYTEFVAGPKGPGQPDGPEEMHVVFVDNGRSEILAGDCREILRCIRCGACLNVCPIYRESSGHAYRGVYSGPVGAVLSPLLARAQADHKADLAKASTLCGACNQVCPVNIPIPDLLLRLRQDAKARDIPSPGIPSMNGWARLAVLPLAWRVALSVGRLVDYLPPSLVPVPALRAWTKARSLPHWRGGKFRAWMRAHRHTRP